ncbi:MAG: hypothetical protein O6848_01055 [Bacteroidetes bacterium]|nr:hypothetical protein [Bacteroidota bacterium]
MKYLHKKMEEVVLDGKKISIEDQTNPVKVAGVSFTCSTDCYLVFGLILLMVGINYL